MALRGLGIEGPAMDLGLEGLVMFELALFVFGEGAGSLEVGVGLENAVRIEDIHLRTASQYIQDNRQWAYRPPRL